MDTMSNTSFHDGRWFVPPSRGEADCGEENRDVNGGNDDGFQWPEEKRCIRDACFPTIPGEWDRASVQTGNETREEGIHRENGNVALK